MTCPEGCETWWSVRCTTNGEERSPVYYARHTDPRCPDYHGNDGRGCRDLHKVMVESSRSHD